MCVSRRSCWFAAAAKQSMLFTCLPGCCLGMMWRGASPPHLSPDQVQHSRRHGWAKLVVPKGPVVAAAALACS